MSTFSIKKANTGIMFNLKADSGQVIATAEVCTTAASCETSIESVRRNAPIAALEDQTVEGFAAAKCPKFEIYVDNAGEFRFRLKATNGDHRRQRRLRGQGELRERHRLRARERARGRNGRGISDLFRSAPSRAGGAIFCGRDVGSFGEPFGQCSCAIKQHTGI